MAAYRSLSQVPCAPGCTDDIPCLTWLPRLLCSVLHTAVSHTLVMGWISIHSYFAVTLRCCGLLCTAVFRWGFLCQPLSICCNQALSDCSDTAHQGRAERQTASAARISSHWGRCPPSTLCRPCLAPLPTTMAAVPPGCWQGQGCRVAWMGHSSRGDGHGKDWGAGCGSER